MFTNVYTFLDVNSCAGGIPLYKLQNCIGGWLGGGVDLYLLAKHWIELRKYGKWSQIIQRLRIIYV